MNIQVLLKKLYTAGNEVDVKGKLAANKLTQSPLVERYTTYSSPAKSG